MPDPLKRRHSPAAAEAVNSREAQLLRLIAAHWDVNQRQISQHLRMSLGMTNLLIRRLAARGYIQVAPVNKRKARYVLTAKGRQELTRRSLETAARAIEIMGRVRRRLLEILSELYGRGERRFYLLGDSELVPLIQQIVSHAGMEGCTLSTQPAADRDGVVLVCSSDQPFLGSSKKRVDLIVELARKDEWVVG